MRRPVLITALAALSVAAATLVHVLPAAAAEPYLDPSLPVSQRVADLMSRMSLDEKLGQMTQAERASASAADVTQYRLGSILSGGGSAPSPNTASSWADMTDTFQRGALATPLKIPLVYGSDAVHGHNNVVGATLFPHNIGLGATRDPALVQQVGRVTADEVRGTGVQWTFSPCLCVARNDRWGRTYESFGEKPELPVSMATIIDGYQSGGVLATAKHYVGDGGTTGGVDQGDTQISETELRAIHLPPFQEAVRRHVASVMVSFSSFNGQKLHGNDYLINGVLKGELGFDGFVVSDWNGIDQIEGGTGFTASEVRRAVNAGIDMVMVPTAWKQFIDTLRGEVQAGRVPLARIDDAVRRILTKKFEFGLFERPFADRSLTGTVGSSQHRAVARQAVRESQVLLKNTGVLPLAKSGRIFVAGKSADNIGLQSGGWTVSWQGAAGSTTPGTTILQGIRAAAGSSATVTYNAAGSGIDRSYGVAVAVIGETPYAEGQGDRPNSLGLDATDLQTLSTLKASGVPVVVVLVSGRPVDIAAQLPDWSGLVAAWLPGTEGAGVADVLFGDYAPTGKLPMTWMQSASQEPINDGDGKTPLFAYGYGLTYATTPPPDGPGTPGTPVVSAVTSTSATLTWTAPASGTAAVSYRVYRGGTLLATVASTSYALSGLTPNTTTTYTVVAVDSAGRTGPASGAATVTTPPTTTSPPPSSPPPTAACAVTYSVNDWGGGFTGTVALKNTGSTTLNGWTLSFTFPGNQKVSQGWSATWSQSGAVVSAKSEAWNGTLAPGATQSAGFNGTYSGSNPRPTAFTLNGATCTVG
ncbi:glycoside hydrolase family 3 N-terminal domain-containing protein [Dactylosporangium sp. CS-047395]|uniref:glycoside hydrolase family 3 N-terminal domain-containing protein n=1 Tax=Dactylosporangium sp. CS-047395 TaxID=3239936 RepID=UPI003D8E1A3C